MPLICAPYVLYGANYIGPASFALSQALLEKSCTGLVAELLIGLLWAIFYAEDFACNATLYGLPLPMLVRNHTFGLASLSFK